MRFSRLVGIAALSAVPSLAPGALSAQASSTPTRPISIGVSGGASIPIGNLGDAVDVGYNVTGHILFAPATRQSLGFRGDVGWDSWKYKGIAGSDAVDGKYRELSVSGNVLYRIPTSNTMRPYLLGGVGYYSGKASVAGVSGDSDNNFGLQAGAGLEFNLSGFSTFLEAKFVNVFAGSDDSSTSSSSSVRWAPITFGIRF